MVIFLGVLVLEFFIYGWFDNRYAFILASESDFIGRADYHAAADFPVKLVFFADGELYEVAYAADGQETLVSHALRGSKGGSRRMIVLDTPTQISKIDCPGLSAFCTVSADGQTQYFKKAGGT